MSCQKTYINLPDGTKMPRIGLGTWQATDEKELEEALQIALEAGYRHIDTAFIYGNEHVVGRVINQWISSGKLTRDDLYIVTKLPPSGIQPNLVEEYLTKSLDNLKLDYVDLYLIHVPFATSNYIQGEPFSTMKCVPTDHLGVWKEMEKQVDAGRTKSIGVSNFNIRQIDRILKNCRIQPANLQVELHVYLQQKELVKFCHDNKISVVAYAPLGSPGYNKFRTNIGLKEDVLPDILNDPVIIETAAKHNKTKGQILLRFLLEKNLVVIPKSVTPSRIKENLDLLGFELDAEDMKKIEALDRGEKARIATMDVVPGAMDHPEYPFGN